MNMNHRFILPVSLVSLLLGGGAGPANASAARTISVNFSNENKPLNSGAYKDQNIGYGGYAVPGTAWLECNQCGAFSNKPTKLVEGLAFTDNTGDSSAYGGVKLYVCAKGFWSANAVKDGNSQMLHAYLDGQNGNIIPKAGFKLENIPFARYTALVYFNSDMKEAKIPAYEINGAFYKGTNGMTMAATETETWGAPHNSTVLDLNKNTLIVTNLTGTLTVQCSEASSVNTRGIRGSIAGFQVVEQKDDIVWTGGDGLWSDPGKWTAPWEDGAGVIFPENGGTVGVDTAVAAASIAFNGSYTFTNAGGSIALSGPVTVEEGEAVTIAAPLSGTLNKEGGGALVFDPDLCAAGPCSFSGPVTIRDGRLSSPVTLAADAALTLEDASLQTPLAGNGASLIFRGTNTIGAGAASLSGFASAAFAAGSLTRVAGDVTLFLIDAVAAGENSGLAVEPGAKLSYSFSIGTNLPAFTKLDGTVEVKGALTSGQIAPGVSLPVAKVADGVSIDNKFMGAVTTAAGNPIGVAFTLGEGGIVLMSAVLNPDELVYAKKDGVAEFTWDKAENIFDNGTFDDFDNVTFLAGGLGSQQVAVNVTNAVAPGRVTIDGAGFSFTGLPVNALSVVKTGEGAAAFPDGVVAGDAAAAGGSWEAGAMAAGTVAVSNGAVFRAKTLARRTMRFLRLTVTEDWGANQPAVAELRLFRKTPRGHDPIAWPAGTKLSDNRGFTSIYRGGGGTATPKFDGDSGDETPSKLIDGKYGPGGDRLNKWWPQAIPSWVLIEFPAAIPAADGYNLCAADYSSRDPKAWTVEISPDGADGHWTTVGRETEQAFGANAWSVHDSATRMGGVPAFFFDDPAEVTEVAVAADGALVADGAWAAGLALAAGATLRAVTNGTLLLRTAGASASVDSRIAVDLSAYASDTAGKNYILAGPAADWPPAGGFTVTGGALSKDDGGYYVDFPARTLAWAPGDGIPARTWKTGFDETPWADGGGAAPAFFRTGDNVAFGNLGTGANLAAVKVSGEVRPASATFSAADGGTAYLFRPADAGAKIVLANRPTVKGLVTNRVPLLTPGLTVGAGGRLVMEAPFGTAPDKPNDFTMQEKIEPGAALVLAPAAGAEQWISGNITGGGDLVKDGEGTVTITGQINNSQGRLAVLGGTLVIDTANPSVTATEEDPITVGPGAALVIAGWGKNRLKGGAWVSCSGGAIAFTGGWNLLPDGDSRASFILTNSLFTAEGNGTLDQLRLYDSRIRFPNKANAPRIEPVTLIAGGDSDSSYSTAPNVNQDKKEQLSVGTINVLAGGRFNAGVNMTCRKGAGTIAKTGPGTLVVSRDAVFEVALNVNEGTLALPQDAGAFARPVTFADGTAIDVSGRADAFAWGANLAVPAGARVQVDVAGRAIKAGDALMTWSAKPDGGFKLVGIKGYSVKKDDDALRATSGGTVFILR